MGTYLPLIYHVGDQPFTYSVFLCGGTLVLGRRPSVVFAADLPETVGGKVLKYKLRAEHRPLP